MPAHRPSLNALRAFEAAARHMSFSQAARELHVTPAAIGHQIRALEEQLEAVLFVRLNRAVELTDAGRALLPGVSDAFSRLHDAVDAFTRRNAERPLIVSVEPEFASKWLVARLDRFREMHPGIDIRIDATARVVDFAREEVDLAIRYGHGDYPDLQVDCLAPEFAAPVCSPVLLQGPHPLREPADLQYHTLLRGEWNPDFPTWPDWPMWLRAAGLEHLPVRYSAAFSGQSHALVLQAAIDGRGVALASSVLTEDDLASGRLVRPFDFSFPVEFCYWVVCPRATADAPKTRAFREWLLRQVPATSGVSAFVAGR